MSTRRISWRVVAIWAALAALVALIVYVDAMDRTSRTPVGPNSPVDERSLLPLPIDQVGAVEIGRAGELHRFERDAAGKWFYHGVHAETAEEHEHISDAHISERIAYSFGGLDRALIERRLALDPASDVYGISRPEMVILVYALPPQEPIVQYAVGDVAPDVFSRYVLISGQTEVVTIPEFQIENLVGLIEEMQGLYSDDREAEQPS